MDLPVLIPVRGLSQSKSQLRLDTESSLVSQAVKAMLDNTIACVESRCLEIFILSADEKLADIYGNRTREIMDTGESLNLAVKNAVDNLDYDIFMLIMADLPGLNTAVIDKIMSLHRLHPYIIAPTADGGTAIAILPAQIMSAGMFGENSASRIMKICDEMKIPLAQIIIEELKHDLDNKEEWEYWCGRVDYITC